MDKMFMVVSKPDQTYGYGVKTGGLTYAGVGYAIFATYAEAARYQLANGLRSKTDIIEA